MIDPVRAQLFSLFLSTDPVAEKASPKASRRKTRSPIKASPRKPAASDTGLSTETEDEEPAAQETRTRAGRTREVRQKSSQAISSAFKKIMSALMTSDGSSAPIVPQRSRRSAR